VTMIMNLPCFQGSYPLGQAVPRDHPQSGGPMQSSAFADAFTWRSTVRATAVPDIGIVRPYAGDPVRPLLVAAAHRFDENVAAARALSQQLECHPPCPYFVCRRRSPYPGDVLIGSTNLRQLNI